jgi:hypothetical protein
VGETDRGGVGGDLRSEGDRARAVVPASARHPRELRSFSSKAGLVGVETASREGAGTEPKPVTFDICWKRVVDSHGWMLFCCC